MVQDKTGSKAAHSSYHVLIASLGGLRLDEMQGVVLTMSLS